MKKIMNAPEQYTDDMLRGIYAAYPEQVRYTGEDLRCYCVTKKKPGKVAIVTGGGTGHLPLFLGYVGEGMLDGCGVGGVFQSPSAEQIYKISREVDTGAGVLYLYGNYTGDIMTFDMAAEMCEMENIKTCSIVGADDVHSAPKERAESRRGIAGIFFMYKAAGARAAQMGTLEEVLDAAQKAKEATRTVGFALSPCIIPEIGKESFSLNDNEMAMGMGIHGEPGIWVGPLKKADEIAEEALDSIFADMPIEPGDEVCVLVNGLGATPIEELYILNQGIHKYLRERKISVYRTFVGEFATSMEMAGASISVCKMDGELKSYVDYPVHTPFYTQI